MPLKIRLGLCSVGYLVTNIIYLGPISFHKVIVYPYETW